LTPARNVHLTTGQSRKRFRDTNTVTWKRFQVDESVKAVAMASRRPTIHDVAKAAGVAISSVSRVLNGHTSNRETIERVERAVREVGYVPSAVAQSLKTQQTGQIAFAMEDVGNAAYLAMVRTIQPVLREAGYRLLLHSTGGDVRDEIEVLGSLSQRYVDGLVLCPIRVTDEHLRALDTPSVPVVVIGSLPDDVPVDNVRADSRRGAKLAMQHLAEQGRRRIALVDGPADTVPGKARYLGYQDGLEAAGVAEDPDLVAFTDFSLGEGAKAAAAMLRHEPRPDAFFAANDVLALGVLQAVREAGLSVPEDVAVIGMDDTELAVTAWPPLSSVSLGAAERGRLAAELLLERLADTERDPQRLTVPPQLVIRASSQALRTHPAGPQSDGVTPDAERGSR
jgi:LacI family transcriptional regulator